LETLWELKLYIPTRADTGCIATHRSLFGFDKASAWPPSSLACGTWLALADGAAPVRCLTAHAVRKVEPEVEELGDASAVGAWLKAFMSSIGLGTIKNRTKSLLFWKIQALGQRKTSACTTPPASQTAPAQLQHACHTAIACRAPSLLACRLPPPSQLCDRACRSPPPFSGFFHQY
jgi:hypothetical protein